ncbi:hypothetical protein [Longimicrobium sp.]|uniref:hypothetical protein n=1 Tax=Longimicrobium sp. TaxID=2029185 RepID=UPI002CD8DBA4|nr:hypothetical protein [Longimicrobium sp.]HSU17894.1 hypothetical protein [Longimicrobium sp.]
MGDTEWVFTLGTIVMIGIAVIMPPMIVWEFRIRAREAAGEGPAPSRSLLRRERPGPKRRTPAAR